MCLCNYLILICLCNYFLVAVLCRSVLLGIACNEVVKDLKLNLSGNCLAESGATEVLEVSLPTVSNIASLDISDNSKHFRLPICAIIYRKME